MLEGELTCVVGNETVVASELLRCSNHEVFPTRYTTRAQNRCGFWRFTPGGFETYFDEYEKITSKFASEEIDDAEHRSARAELGSRYGVIWHDERIPEARARFGIGPWPHRSGSGSEVISLPLDSGS